MQIHSFPFAVRLIGFPGKEADSIDAIFTAEQSKGYGYFRLADDNLQDPDLYLVNAEALKALVTLSDLAPSDVRPALLVGTPGVPLPYPRIERPLLAGTLFEALDRLVEKRADALSRLGASGVVTVPERRRRDRVDLDLTDPGEYTRMRARLPVNGGILIVDKNPAFRTYVSDLLMRHNMPVAWVADEAKAADLCSQQSMAVVMVNTATPGIDPYRLCKSIKQTTRVEKTTVIFLISKPVVYDTERARGAGVDGYLNKPVATHHLLTVLKKFLPSLAR
ncbi:MAG TPA: response regulator [Oxalobacteraceae bacterium]|jgi:CheY-like chemotaxis protein|nr:response regulator [Oxalobacteraceae bacterium]HCN87997.1 response regulator [Oxalobacteraceae bacterium]